MRHENADDLHMLGYWVDTAALAPAMRARPARAGQRAGEIVERLKELGVDVTLEDAIAEAGDACRSAAPTSPGPPASKPDEMGAFFEE